MGRVQLVTICGVYFEERIGATCSGCDANHIEGTCGQIPCKAGDRLDGRDIVFVLVDPTERITSADADSLF